LFRKYGRYCFDEEVGKQEFLEIIKGVYKRDIYIYAILPEWEEELLDAMSNDFILINKIHLVIMSQMSHHSGLVEPPSGRVSRVLNINYCLGIQPL